MANGDDTIKLIVDMGASSRNVEAVTQDLEQLGTSATRAADASRALDRVGQSAEGAGRSAGVASMKMIELGRVIQDFSAAGLAGITNNVEGLARSFGLGAGIAGTATMAATALWLLLPAIRAFFDSLKPENTKQADALADALDKLDKRSAELKGKLRDLAAQWTPNAEGARALNAELDAQLKVEEALLKARERPAAEAAAGRVRAAAAAAGPTAEEQRLAGEAKQRADQIAQQFGGDVLRRIMATLLRQAGPGGALETREQTIAAFEAERAGISREAGPDQLQRLARRREIERQIGLLRQGETSEAIEMHAEAIRRRRGDLVQGIMGRFVSGDEAALAQVARLMPAGELREQLQRMTFGARFAAGARDVGREAMAAGRGMIEGQVGRVQGMMDLAHQGLVAIGQRNAAAAEKTAREMGPEYPGARAAEASREAVRRAADREVEKKADQAIDLSRRLDRAMAGGGGPSERMPLLRPGAGMEEIGAAAALNERALAENQRALHELNLDMRRTARINRENSVQFRQPNKDAANP